MCRLTERVRSFAAPAAMMRHVLRKLDVASRVQAAVIATEHGLG